MPTMKETVTYPSANGTDQIVAKICKPSLAPIKGIVQISHGMCEYIDRYDEFMDFLLANNYAVCGNDHLGHGKSAASAEALGFFAEKDGAACLVEDLHTLTGLVKAAVPGVPLFLLGHSMGSFIARQYAALYADELAGLIVCGTAGPRWINRISKVLAAAEIKRIGPRERDKLLDQLAFGSFNMRYRDKRTKHDWLSRDREIVDRYEKDELCTFTFTAGAFRDLFTLLEQVNSDAWFAALDRDLPVYLISGDMDPVGGYGKGVSLVYEKLCEAGMRDVMLGLYEDGRHEMLNEVNRSEVFGDILRWISARTNRS